MKEIIDRLQEGRQVELAKSILESKGYKVTKRLKESLLSKKFNIEPSIEETLMNLEVNSRRRSTIDRRFMIQEATGTLSLKEVQDIYDAIDSTGNYYLLKSGEFSYKTGGIQKEYVRRDAPNFYMTTQEYYTSNDKHFFRFIVQENTDLESNSEWLKSHYNIDPEDL